VATLFPGLAQREISVSLTAELERFVRRKVESGLYNNASEVVREGLRLLKEHDDIPLKWREQIERGWVQAQAGQVVDGPRVMAEIKNRLRAPTKKRA
jgi:antitoxin ParD1/3/4